MLYNNVLLIYTFRSSLLNVQLISSNPWLRRLRNVAGTSPFGTKRAKRMAQMSTPSDLADKPEGVKPTYKKNNRYDTDTRELAEADLALMNLTAHAAKHYPNFNSAMGM